MAFWWCFGKIQFGRAPESQRRRITVVDARFILRFYAVAAGTFTVAFYLAPPAQSAGSGQLAVVHHEGDLRTLLAVCAVAPVQHRSSCRLISQLGK